MSNCNCACHAAKDILGALSPKASEIFTVGKVEKQARQVGPHMLVVRVFRMSGYTSLKTGDVVCLHVCEEILGEKGNVIGHEGCPHGD